MLLRWTQIEYACFEVKFCFVFSGLKGCHCQVYDEQYVFIVINDRNVCFNKFARVVHVSLRKISRLAVLLPGPYLGRLADCQLRTTPLRRYSSCIATFAYSRFILNPNNLIIPAKFLFQIESRLVPISTHLQCTNSNSTFHSNFFSPEDCSHKRT